jgi:hypothetical protein
MGWTYEEYLSQPTAFILVLLGLFHAEGEHQQSKL